MIAGPLAHPAQAQPSLYRCLPAKEFDEHLMSQYAETPRFVGVLSDGRLVEFLAAETGTFTVAVRAPDMVCIHFVGHDWLEIKKRDPST